MKSAVKSSKQTKKLLTASLPGRHPAGQTKKEKKIEKKKKKHLGVGYILIKIN